MDTSDQRSPEVTDEVLLDAYMQNNFVAKIICEQAFEAMKATSLPQSPQKIVDTFPERLWVHTRAEYDANKASKALVALMIAMKPIPQRPQRPYQQRLRALNNMQELQTLINIQGSMLPQAPSHCDSCGREVIKAGK